jgi:hypothetical protein
MHLRSLELIKGLGWRVERHHAVVDLVVHSCLLDPLRTALGVWMPACAKLPVRRQSRQRKRAMSLFLDAKGARIDVHERVSFPVVSPAKDDGDYPVAVAADQVQVFPALFDR